ncbi:MAG: glyoxalase [Solirubrobacteraceae bacterium]|jgi:hypothetical protein
MSGASATLDEIVLADEPERWATLGFTVAGGCCELGGVRLRFAGLKDGPGILGWSLWDLASTELDGLPTTRAAGAPRARAGAHPNGVLGLDHIVAISPQLDRSVKALRHARLDLRRLREQPTPAGAPRQAFFRLGEAILELVQEPDEVLERSGGPDRPAFFWGLALVSDDLERTAELIGSSAGSIRPAVQSGRRILTLRRSAGLAVPLALISSPTGGGERG